MITHYLKKDYLDALIAEYEAEKSRTAKSRRKKPGMKHISKKVIASPGISGQGTLTCEHCGRAFTTVRGTGRFCCVRCRKAAYRKRKGEEIYARLGISV